MSVVIGLAGKAGSGKNTVAGILKEDFGFALISNAYPIKQMLCTLLDVPVEKWEDRKWRNETLPVFGCTPRRLAQTLGTEWGRNCVDDDLWLNLAKQRMQQTKNVDFWAFTDIRFNNEAGWIRHDGGYIIHVYRPVTESEAVLKHSSESGVSADLSGRDFYINNSGSLETLKAQVFAIMDAIAEKAIKEGNI